jgi:flagellar basal body rod protein FlgB
MIFLAKPGGRAHFPPRENPDLLATPTEGKWNLNLKVSQSKEGSREDGNNVQLEKEMSDMSGNSILYITAIKILSKEMALARYAVTNGNR